MPKAERKGPHGGKIFTDEGTEYELLASRWSGWYKIYVDGTIVFDGGFSTETHYAQDEWNALAALERNTNDFLTQRRTEIHRRLRERRSRVERELGINFEDYVHDEKNGRLTPKPLKQAESTEPETTAAEAV